MTTFATLQEVQQAVRNGHSVFWKNGRYKVILHIFKSGDEQWLVGDVYNHSCIGLIGNPASPNHKPEDFFIVCEQQD